jgi:hypothetical protein
MKVCVALRVKVAELQAALFITCGLSLLLMSTPRVVFHLKLMLCLPNTEAAAESSTLVYVILFVVASHAAKFARAGAIPTSTYDAQLVSVDVNTCLVY